MAGMARPAGPRKRGGKAKRGPIRGKTPFAGKGKVFAMLDDHHHGAPHLSVWLPAGPGAQEALIDSDPKRYFRPAYVGSSGWVGVVLDTLPDWLVVAWLVEQAFRLVANPRLVAQLPRVDAR